MPSSSLISAEGAVGTCRGHCAQDSAGPKAMVAGVVLAGAVLAGTGMRSPILGWSLEFKSLGQARPGHPFQQEHSRTLKSCCFPYPLGWSLSRGPDGALVTPVNCSWEPRVLFAEGHTGSWLGMVHLSGDSLEFLRALVLS